MDEQRIQKIRERLQATTPGAWAVFVTYAKDDIAYLLEWRGNLLRQLEAAIEIVKKSGEDSYICDGLSIAKDIVGAGPDADVHELMQGILDEFGF